MPQIIMPYTVHLDHTLRVTPLSTLFVKGDSAAHRFELTIMRAGVQEGLTGCTVMYKFYRMTWTWLLRFRKYFFSLRSKLAKIF